MERPTAPLPPIPSETEISEASLDLVGEARVAHLPAKEGTPTTTVVVVATTPPPGEAAPPLAQPNQCEMGVEALDRRPSSIASRSRSLASSTESAVHVTASAGGGGEEGSPIFSMNPEDYHVGPAVGFGSSAIVYHTVYLPANMVVAVKMIDLDHFERNQIDELRREIQVMTLCKHANLLRILASFVHRCKLWIVTPYLSGGSCLDIMKTGFRDGLEETAIATILHQALLGLEYLHRNGHIHRDVKAGNLLMDQDGTVQLADFGVSSSLMEDTERRGVRKTFVGTPCWMAPEVMEMSSRGYDAKADIWSFGITALELAYGHAPFSKHPPMKVIYLTLSSAPPTLDRKRCRHKYSRAFKDMIDACLQKEPTQRYQPIGWCGHSIR